MSVFVKAILTLQRQVRNLTRRINRLSGGASTGGTITADTTISDDYTNGYYFVNISSTAKTITLPTPEVGKKFKFMLVSNSNPNLIFDAGSNTITGSITYGVDADEPFIVSYYTGNTYTIENFNQGSWFELSCVDENNWMINGIKSYPV